MKDKYILWMPWLGAAILVIIVSLVVIFYNPPTAVPATPSAESTSSVASAVSTTTEVSAAQKVSSNPIAPPVVLAPSIPTHYDTIDLPYIVTDFNSNAWSKNWGMLSIKNGVLDFGASSSTTGGTVLLNGGDMWTNYNAQATITWVKGKAFDIFARFSDVHNFAYCNFGDNYVAIMERSADKEQTVSESYTVRNATNGSKELGIRVYGQKVACAVNGADVLTGTLTVNGLGAGGIGFTSWDPTPGMSEILLTKLSVTSATTDDIVIALPPTSPAAPTSTSAPTPAPTPVPAPVPVALTLPYVQSNFSSPAWIPTWGSVTTDDAGALHVGAKPDSSGGSAFLDNAGDWSNYTVTATLDWPQGQTFSLVARYADANNYVACQFDASDPGVIHIRLQQYLNGTVYNLVDGSDLDFFHEGRTGIVASLKVQDAAGTCSFDNHVLTNSGGNNYTLNPPFHGSVGFNTWDPTLGKTQIIIKKISVQQN